MTTQPITSTALPLALFVASVAGCPNEEPAPVPRPAPESVAHSGACQPAEELAKLDPRAPVPLQPRMAWHQKQNMMEHLVAIQRITDGLAREDWDEVASASALIESSPRMQQMCQHMGAGASGFTEVALDFHRRAEAIGVAARAHDGAAVLRATSHTLQSCTGCHAAFRQEIVDATTWQARTGQAHDPAMLHGEH
jgi:hypothetical protein